MLFCIDHAPRPSHRSIATSYQPESESSVEYRLFIANQTFHITFNRGSQWHGTVIRASDGVEASFSSRSCLEHVLEGLLGRRIWAQYRQQVLAMIEQFQP
ncbi:MAG: hypothetical protein K6356_06010 [Chloroflexus sp.]